MLAKPLLGFEMESAYPFELRWSATLRPVDANVEVRRPAIVLQRNQVGKSLPMREPFPICGVAENFTAYVRDELVCDAIVVIRQGDSSAV